MLSQVQNILKYLYPVPKPDSKRVITFANHEDYISFRLLVGLCFPLIIAHLTDITCTRRVDAKK